MDAITLLMLVEEIVEDETSQSTAQSETRETGSRLEVSGNGARSSSSYSTSLASVADPEDVEDKKDANPDEEDRNDEHSDNFEPHRDDDPSNTGDSSEDADDKEQLGIDGHSECGVSVVPTSTSVSNVPSTIQTSTGQSSSYVVVNSSIGQLVEPDDGASTSFARSGSPDVIDQHTLLPQASGSPKWDEFYRRRADTLAERFLLKQKIKRSWSDTFISPTTPTKRFRHMATQTVEVECGDPDLNGIKHLVFVDVENVPAFLSKLPIPLPARTYLWLCHGKASHFKEPLSNDAYKEAKNRGIVHMSPPTSEVKDSADCAIIEHFGRMAEKLPADVRFSVVSKDHIFGQLGEMTYCHRNRTINVINLQPTATLNANTQLTIAHARVYSMLDD